MPDPKNPPNADITRENATLVQYSDDGTEAIVRVQLAPTIITYAPFERTIPASTWRKVTGEPEPDFTYPVPVEAIAAYWQRIFTAGDAHYDAWFDLLPLDLPGLAQKIALNYDGLHCWDVMTERTDSDEQALRFKTYADRVWYYGNRPSFLQEPETGLAGYFNYTRGMSYRANVDFPKYLEASMRGAYLCALSQPVQVNTSDWMTGFARPVLARERALSVYSHIDVWYVDPPQRWIDDTNVRADLRDKYVRSAVEDHILGVHFPTWLAVDPDDWSTVTDPAKEWAPFMMALSARALIHTLESGLADEWGVRAMIETKLVQLADLVWDLAARQEDGPLGRWGLFERPTPARNEPPSFDTSMLSFPWFCYCAKLTEERRFFERAEKLIVGQSAAWIEPKGQKQLNQSIMWVADGLEWAGWG